MSESPAKVRLVRCPKCENLLPEVTDYAVYQCGGCGAVLRAENKRVDSGMSSEKSGDESETISTKIPKESSNLRSVNSMSLGSENGVTKIGSGLDNSIEFKEPKPVFANTKTGSRRSVRASNWRYTESDLQEGSSSCHFAPPPRHEYAELVQGPNDHLEVQDDRAELLRKLDELKYEIVRSRDKSHSVMSSSNQVQVFTDPFRSQNHRRGPVLPYEQNPYPQYYSGPYVSNEMTDNRLFHHPSFYQAPPPPSPPIVPPVFNRRFSNISLNSRNSEPRSRWSNEIRRPPRGILAAGARRCRPVAGGSPFVSCRNCYELLQVPRKNIKKVRCASCSEVMVLSVVSKRLVLSVYKESDKDPGKSNENRKTHEHAKWGGTFSSEEYDNSGNYDFESMDKLRSSEDEIKVNIILDENPNPADVDPNVNKPSPPPSGSPLQDHFEYSTKYNRAGKGNVSKRSEIERVEKLVNGSMKDAAVASEIEISSNEYCVNTGTSLESGDTDRQRENKTFFERVIKKSFREFSRSSQHVDPGKVNVTVNGHPIPDRLVKKAEKLAGPVLPGDYWYDPRAGFWGMMGGPCRGIVPPFIEEFNHPMPDNCADGNTNVFVNGRELHQNDLDLLVRRGLPTESHRSYVIEISGRVLDEESGLELDGLGKLAPTVERKRHGFGMKPPRTDV